MVADREKIIRICSDIIDEKLEPVEGTRKLLPLIGDFYDEDAYIVFQGFDSETDDLPTGEQKALWNQDALLKKRREKEHIINGYKPDILSACQKIISMVKEQESL